MVNVTVKKREGLSQRTLLFWGIIAVIAGDLVQGLLENGADTQRFPLLLATVAVLLKSSAAVGAPIVVYCLYRLFTGGIIGGRTLFSVFFLALISEIPYDLLIHGQIFVSKSSNFLISLCVGLSMLWLFSKFSDKSPRCIALRIAVAFFALLWVILLSAELGVVCILTFLVTKAFKGREDHLPLGLSFALSLCSFISPYYMSAPLGAAFLHFRRDERDPLKELIPLLSIYPIALGFGIAASFFIN